MTVMQYPSFSKTFSIHFLVASFYLLCVQYTLLIAGPGTGGPSHFDAFFSHQQRSIGEVAIEKNHARPHETALTCKGVVSLLSLLRATSGHIWTTLCLPVHGSLIGRTVQIWRPLHLHLLGELVRNARTG